jgi:streptogramin lyase
MGNKVGVFDPVPARFEEFDIPTFASLPGDMAIDLARNRLWFSETGTEAKRLGMLSMTKARTTMAAAKTAAVSKASPEEYSTVLAISAVVALLVAFGSFFVFWRRRPG